MQARKKNYVGSMIVSDIVPNISTTLGTLISRHETNYNRPANRASLETGR